MPELTPPRVPAVVTALARTAATEKIPNPTPISWRVEKEYVVIVFEDGRKLTFEQTFSGVEPVKEESADAPRSHPKRKEK